MAAEGKAIGGQGSPFCRSDSKSRKPGSAMTKPRRVAACSHMESTPKCDFTAGTQEFPSNA